MEIKNKKSRSLTTFEEWEEGFVEVDKKTHWSKGYSAYSLGLFFTSGKGEKWLYELEQALFGEVLNHTAAEIEHASKLDSFRGGQRMQDLAIWGSTKKGESCFIGIEAKVLEPFGDSSVYDSYVAGIEEREKRNPNSNKAERVSQVISYLFPGKTPDDDEVKNLRYQLAHYFKASILEAPSLSESSLSLNNRAKADIVLLPVIVFMTDHYKTNPELAKDNHADYDSFVNALGCEKKRFGKHEVYYLNIDGRDVYTVFEVIEL